MHYLIELYQQFSEYAKVNPVLAGAFSLYALGAVTFLFRGLPVSIFTFIKNQLITTLTFSNSGYGYTIENFSSFLVWFEKHKWSKYSRALSMDYNNDYDKSSMTVGVGSGHHFFFYKNRFFILHRYVEAKAGSSQLIHIIHLTMVGRKKKILYDLIDEFSYKLPEHKLSVWKYNGEWSVCSTIEQRKLNTVIIDKTIKNKILSVIDEFKDSQDWYIERGIPYKKIFILHGIPGTGKTSLIKSLAGFYGKNLCLINISSMTDSSFEAALYSVPENSFIVIEDFDSTSAVKSRDDSANPFSDIKPLSLSGILNSLDGIVSLNDKLIFLTTNVLDKIDSALLRKGRVDHIFELKALTHYEIVEYIQLMFPDNMIPENIVFPDILGCDIQSLYLEYHNDFNGFIDSLK